MIDRERLAATLRRRRLLAFLAAASMGTGGITGFIGRALARGDLPATLGINRLTGTATVNGRPAAVGTPVTASDRVATGPGSAAVLVIRDDAFLLREQTTLEFGESRGALARIAIRSGKVLGVFGKKPLELKARHASIGIRGTGAYVEAEPDSLYLCLCYGEADVDGPGMETLRIKTTHHEQPLVFSDAGAAMRIDKGTVRNHSDAELTLLESLVGRTPPFADDLFREY